ncbi:aldehyde dehydrogenase (NADP(+)) [Actinopolyspora erythraea]|uniref:Aldehyde dehydrogenase n=1 Tax=Actinopolyspora erythraea TaxID=414996 RepID=A0A099D237_9ACTN|nr:aldehyde dehydrogenase (NADP(+)) [Actinopolyspora erythraea]ASU77769.1 aldehyde dehydrogenase (NADP(+)) [Actinopolyspora erythraea]KGI79981.1 aldehyde dehydrogenase [Actinopolyspora erythraea]
MTPSQSVSTSDGLETVLDNATAAATRLAATSPAEIGGLLRAVASELDAHAEELVPLAQRESHLPEGRLRGELVRTTFQLRLFAETVEEGAHLKATIDSPDPEWPTGARPDLRRTLLPLGPVLVFAASNFPFAFSVAGGDTASALAAGCPVVVKAHPGHPELSRRTAEIVTGALAEAGAPDGTFALLEGNEPARAALLDERVRAGAFTGSNSGGRALFDLASSRESPIPFYAEMGSVNPAFVTPEAAAGRGAEIARGYLDSYTLGVGQFCTKPGLLLVPASAAQRFRDVLIPEVEQRAPAPMLNEGIETAFHDTLGSLRNHPAVETLVSGRRAEDGVGPTLLYTGARQLVDNRQELAGECFGPVSLLVGYSDTDELLEAAGIFSGELTATVHGNEEESVVAPLFRTLRARAGRLVWNGWPTGVSVSHGMQHGGPYPATTAPTHTSVGTAAIDRFLRPVSFQSAPRAVLPEALRDGNPLGIPRRVNGRMESPEQG